MVVEGFGPTDPVTHSGAATNLLIVCTGNVCRSPAGEMLVRSLKISQVAAESAGTEAMVGADLDPIVRQLLEEDDVEIASFAARQLAIGMVQRSDLILVATNDHRRTILRETPTALRKTFTILEIAELILLLEQEGPLSQLDHSSRLNQLARMRGRRQPDAVDDIIDPYLRSEIHHREAYRAIAAAIRGPIARLLASLAEGELAAD